jgi:hypothetical protein
MGIKEFLRNRIEKKQKEYLTMVQSIAILRIDGREIKQGGWPLNHATVQRLNRDYRMSLMHCYCA